MIKLQKVEYTDSGWAYRVYRLTLFGIVIYTACYKTTNNKAIEVLKPSLDKTKIEGFK